jgi:plasmid stabilization system protein ParE
VDTGEIEFIVDDNAPDRSEDYHDKVAQAIASFLARHPEIADAGHIRYRLDQEWHEITEAYERREREKEQDTLTD